MLLKEAVMTQFPVASILFPHNSKDGMPCFLPDVLQPTLCPRDLVKKMVMGKPRSFSLLKV